MPDKTYYEKQAELFLQLGVATADPDLAERFYVRAATYRARATAAEEHRSCYDGVVFPAGFAPGTKQEHG